jgi:type IV secretory pathway VirJ component
VITRPVSLRRFALVLGAWFSLAPLSMTADEPLAEATPAAKVLTFGRFGDISVYQGSGEPRDVVLFASGDGGWNLGVITMARLLAQQGAIVAGFDIRHYLHELEAAAEKCVSPDADFENLSHFLEDKLGVKKYLQPTLVGYSSGATLVYATLVESPDGLFKGGLSLGFCPDLDLKKPVCQGSGIESTAKRDPHGQLQGVNFRPAKQLSARWIVLQGETDQVCTAPATQKFVGNVPGAEIVMLPKVGHGYSVEKNWVPQYQAAYARITQSRAETALAAPVADLPLIVIPAAAGGSSPWFGVFISGDGGWVGLDKGVSQALAERHIPIVGWDSLKYFWSPRTPESAAQDLDRVLKHYAELFGKSHALLIGYSQGADTMPFMVNRLPPSTRDMVALTTLLGLSTNANFEFHFANWLGGDAREGLPIAPELKRWSGSPYLCLYGESDKDAACAELTGNDGSAVKMSGGHHFGGSYEKIAEQILSRLPKTWGATER